MLPTMFTRAGGRLRSLFMHAADLMYAADQAARCLFAVVACRFCGEGVEREEMEVACCAHAKPSTTPSARLPSCPPSRFAQAREERVCAVTGGMPAGMRRVGGEKRCWAHMLHTYAARAGGMRGYGARGGYGARRAGRARGRQRESRRTTRWRPRCGSPMNSPALKLPHALAHPQCVSMCARAGVLSLFRWPQRLRKPRGARVADLVDANMDLWKKQEM